MDETSAPLPQSMSEAAQGERNISIDGFLRQLGREVQKNMEPGTVEFDALQRIIAELAPQTQHQLSVVPQIKPVVKHWKVALGGIRGGPSASLYRPLKALTPRLRWMQSPHYHPNQCPRAFLENYAYSELVGPDGLCLSTTASMGIMLLGPDTYYPPHVHPSIECLYVLSGRGTWHLENGPTISLPPGTAVFIPYGCPHAFWSMDAPMAAVYLCSGDVTIYPSLNPLAG